MRVVLLGSAGLYSVARSVIGIQGLQDFEWVILTSHKPGTIREYWISGHWRNIAIQ